MKISRILYITLILAICTCGAVFGQNAPKIDGAFIDTKTTAEVNRAVFLKSAGGSFGSSSLMIGTNKGKAMYSQIRPDEIPFKLPAYSNFSFTPSSNALVRDIKFVSDSRGYLLKSDGLYFSNGNSATWTQIAGVNSDSLVKAGLIGELWGMSFVDERRLCLAGVYLKNTTDREIDRELLVCTDDITVAKPKWEDADKPDKPKTVQLQLTHINFDRNKNGWAVGTDGAEGIIWYSKNGGQDWEEEPPAISEPLLGIYGLEKNKAFAVGYNGTIYAKGSGNDNNSVTTTVIRVQTKTNQTENDDNEIKAGDKVEFKPTLLSKIPGISSYAKVIGEVIKVKPGRMLEIKVLQATPNGVRQIAEAYLVARDISADDVTKIESKTDTNKDKKEESNKTEGKNKKNTAITEANSERDSQVNSDENSAQWKKITVALGSPAPNLRSVKFAENNQHGFIVGDKGTILYTQDSGVNWKILPVVAPYLQLKNIDFYSLFIDENYAWAVGNKGAVVRIKYK